VVGRHARIALVIIVGLIAFVALMNLAVIWHGVLMVIGIGPLAYAFNFWLDWANQTTNKGRG
jgi:hypothetical protein